MMLETDCPYLTPDPLEGYNTPKNLPLIAETIAVGYKVSGTIKLGIHSRLRYHKRFNLCISIFHHEYQLHLPSARNREK